MFVMTEEYVDALAPPPPSTSIPLPSPKSLHDSFWNPSSLI